LPAIAVPVLTVKVATAELFDGGVIDVEFNVQLAPVGQPDTTRLTGLLNEFTEVTVTVEFPPVPCVSVSVVGLADMEKFGTGGVFTVPDTVVV